MMTYLYIAIALGIVALIAAIVLAVMVKKLSDRLTRLTTGTNGKNLEEAIYQLMDDHIIFGNRVERVEEVNGRLDSQIKGAVRGIATVRYNAYQDVGGKQSFATAMVCEDGSGVVISSIYARERMNVYAKPVVDFGSEYELSTEEERALKEATKSFE